MPLPTFVIVGAQKAGTTTLHDWLGQLPDVWMSEPKEIHFFDKHVGRGLDWYREQFRPAAQHRAWGESTPIYLYRDAAREGMISALPEARFVAILREPVSRGYSHYWFARSKGKEPLETFEEAVQAEPARLAASKDGKPAAFSYLDRGHYLEQLEALEEAVGRERLLVLLTEDLRRDAVGTLRKVAGFVGADVAAVEGVEVRERNTFSDRTVNSADGLRKQRLQSSHVDTAAGYPPIDPALEQALRESFREENERLAAWLGRDLSDWLPR